MGTTERIWRVEARDTWGKVRYVAPREYDRLAAGDLAAVWFQAPEVTQVSVVPLTVPIDSVKRSGRVAA
jgi:hypothetical protein